MTFKAAVAGVGLGGGKGVICVEPGTELTHSCATRCCSTSPTPSSCSAAATSRRRTSARRRRHAPDRLAHRARRRTAGSLGGLGDPSPYTALGVHAAIRACVAHRFGSAALAGRSASVVGAGHVGERLVRMLRRRRRAVIVADIDERKRALARELAA